MMYEWMQEEEENEGTQKRAMGLTNRQADELERLLDIVLVNTTPLVKGQLTREEFRALITIKRNLRPREYLTYTKKGEKVWTSGDYQKGT